MHPRGFVAVSVVLLLIVTACGKSTSTATSTAIVTPVVTSSSTAPPSGSGSPSPQGSPSAASSETLTLDGRQATSVEVPDPSQPARYATSEDTLYQAQTGGGWSQIGQWDPAYLLLADPADPDILYSGGHPGCAVGGPALSLRKSSDGGRTWETLLTGQNVRPAIVDPQNPQVIYGERCSLAISVDGGQTWTDYAMTLSFDVSALSLTGNTLYLLITSEGGTSRIRPIDVTDPSRPKIGADLREFWGGGTILASAQRIIVGEPHGVDVSTDGGRTWSFSRSGLESVTVSVNALVQPIPNQELSRKFGIYSLAIDPANASRIFAGTIRGLYQSQDDGKTWTRVAAIDEVPVNELAFGRNGSMLYVTTGTGVIVLTNP